MTDNESVPSTASSSSPMVYSFISPSLPCLDAGSREPHPMTLDGDNSSWGQLCSLVERSLPISSSAASEGSSDMFFSREEYRKYSSFPQDMNLNRLIKLQAPVPTENIDSTCQEEEEEESSKSVSPSLSHLTIDTPMSPIRSPLTSLEPSMISMNRRIPSTVTQHLTIDNPLKDSTASAPSLASIRPMLEGERPEKRRMIIPPPKPREGGDKFLSNLMSKPVSVGKPSIPQPQIRSSLPTGRVSAMSVEDHIAYLQMSRADFEVQDGETDQYERLHHAFQQEKEAYIHEVERLGHLDAARYTQTHATVRNQAKVILDRKKTLAAPYAAQYKLVSTFNRRNISSVQQSKGSFEAKGALLRVGQCKPVVPPDPKTPVSMIERHEPPHPKVSLSEDPNIPKLLQCGASSSVCAVVRSSALKRLANARTAWEIPFIIKKFAPTGEEPSVRKIVLFEKPLPPRRMTERDKATIAFKHAYRRILRAQTASQPSVGGMSTMSGVAGVGGGSTHADPGGRQITLRFPNKTADGVPGDKCIEETCISTERNLVYSLVRVGEKSLIVRTSYDGYMRTHQSQEPLLLRSACKLEYRLDEGLEMITTHETAGWWGSVSPHRDAALLLPRVDPFRRSIVHTDIMHPSQLLVPPAQAFELNSSMAILCSLLGTLGQLEEGQYLLTHQPNIPDLRIFAPANEGEVVALDLSSALASYCETDTTTVPFIRTMWTRPPSAYGRPQVPDTFPLALQVSQGSGFCFSYAVKDECPKHPWCPWPHISKMELKQRFYIDVDALKNGSKKGGKAKAKSKGPGKPKAKQTKVTAATKKSGAGGGVGNVGESSGAQKGKRGKARAQKDLDAATNGNAAGASFAHLLQSHQPPPQL
eukprot:Rmarinus@m.4978